jgi:hypothetical protein
LPLVIDEGVHNPECDALGTFLAEDEARVGVGLLLEEYGFTLFQQADAGGNADLRPALTEAAYDLNAAPVPIPACRYITYRAYQGRALALEETTGY